MASRTFIRHQLRKSLCDRVQSVLVLFSSPYFESISSIGSRDIAKSLKIAFSSSFVSLCAFGSKFWQFRFPTALDYLYPFLSFSVHNFFARTDGRTDRHFLKKFYFFLLNYFHRKKGILTLVRMGVKFEK